MGKSQTKKKTAKRHNPIRVPDAHLGAGRVADAEKERQMLPVMAKVSLPRVPTTDFSSARPSTQTGRGRARRSAT